MKFRGFQQNRRAAARGDKGKSHAKAASGTSKNAMQVKYFYSAAARRELTSYTDRRTDSSVGTVRLKPASALKTTAEKLRGARAVHAVDGSEDRMKYREEPTRTLHGIKRHVRVGQSWDQERVLQFAKLTGATHRRFARLEAEEPRARVVRQQLWMSRSSVAHATTGAVVDDHLIDAPRLRSKMPDMKARQRRGEPWQLLWRELQPSISKARAQAKNELAPLGVRDVQLHDGFVAEVEISAADFLVHGEELVRRVPRLRHLHLSECRETLVEVLAVCGSLLRSLYSLGLRENNLGDDDVHRLVSYPPLTLLRWLDLRDNRLTNRAVQALASARYLDDLVYVGLNGNADVSDPLHYVDVDHGQVIGRSTNRLGRALENESPKGYLAWIHARWNFGPFFPPSPGEGSAFAPRILSAERSSDSPP